MIKVNCPYCNRRLRPKHNARKTGQQAYTTWWCKHDQVLVMKTYRKDEVIR